MQVGQVVKATAGRDKGSFFAVTYAAGAEVYIADGKTRRLGRPKRKNARHIEATDTIIDLNDKTDKRLRRFLKEFKEQCLKSQGR